jgi:tungstate transport system ATP-binding protein
MTTGPITALRPTEDGKAATETPRDNARPILPLELRGVAYEAGGQRLIADLSLVIDHGPLTVILGPNGSGKTLTLRLCHGLIAPSAGVIRWAGAAIPPHQAMVFQRPVMLRRSVAGNIEYGLKVNGVNRAERRRRTDEAIVLAGLSDLAQRPARVLSGGEMQRVSIARAWALRPQVLFLDEPTANLDPSATRIIESVLSHIHHAGTKIVMTTHDLGQARRLSDEIVFLSRGRLAERQPTPAFFDTPQTAEARAFIEGRLLW